MNLSNLYNSKHLMIDVETLDTEPTSVLLSLSGTFFQLDDDESNCFFDVKFKLNDQIKNNRTISEETFFWWLKNNELARLDIANAERRYNLYEGLMEFMVFINRNIIDDKFFVWSKSPNFDIIIIENCLKYYNIEIPWRYSNIRDVRTIESLSPEITKSVYNEFNANTHVSLVDCIIQIKTIRKILNQIKNVS